MTKNQLKKDLKEMQVRIIRLWFLYQVLLPMVILVACMCIFSIFGEKNFLYNVVGRGELLFSWGIVMMALSVDFVSEVGHTMKYYFSHIVAFLFGFLYIILGMSMKFMLFFPKVLEESMVDIVTLNITGWILGILITITLKHQSIEILADNIKKTTNTN